MKFSQLVEQLAALNPALPQPLPCDRGADPNLTGVAAIDEAPAGTVSYIEGAKFAAQMATTQASALILPQDATLQSAASERGLAWVAAADPRLMFAQAIAQFYQPYRPPARIHASAVVDPTAVVGEGVSIGAHVVIEAGVTIGDHVCIHPNVVIYPGSAVGDRTILHANCVIHEHVRIECDCVIHSGAVIGAEGFGFVPTREGWYKMQQSGYVVLESGVEVGCNSTIDRPAVGETRVGRNTKIDNLVHIAHGCHIGEACALAGQVGLAGGVRVGNRVILAGQVGVANAAKIGDGAIASAKTGIHGNVEPGQLVSGYPYVDHKTYLKSSAVYSRLPEMYQTLKRLQKKLDEVGTTSE
jgi:UDP-3-O-[3-hydroxymyristoyl] glucosamine N-acyltransferase